jgi:hypothetical protein
MSHYVKSKFHLETSLANAKGAAAKLFQYTHPVSITYFCNERVYVTGGQSLFSSEEGKK